MQTEVFTFIGSISLMESIHAQPETWRSIIREQYPHAQFAICYQQTLTPGEPPRCLVTVRPTIEQKGLTMDTPTAPTETAPLGEGPIAPIPTISNPNED